MAQLIGIQGSGQAAIEYLMRCSPLRLIALTRGPAGSSLFSRDGTSDHPGFPAQVVDTVGAGDAFTAALVMGLIDHHPLDRINAFANLLAAYVCSQPGATPPIPKTLLAKR